MISFLVINFHQLIGSHKEAQNAVDAAALQAAIDVSRIVVSQSDGTYFGNVGLVDQPAQSASKRPVISINTLLATVRLDAIIADELGNGAMQVAAAEDLAKAQSDSAKLRKKVLSAVYPKYDKDNVKDRDGNRIDLLTDVETIFDKNAINMAQGKRIGHLKITAGQFTTTNFSSNIPIPEGDSKATDHGTDTASKFYKAYTPIDTNITDPTGAKHNLPIILVAMADAPSLVSNDNYESYDPTDTNASLYLAPSVVQVTGEQEIRSAANMKSPQEKEQPEVMKSTLNIIATAVCGAQRQSFASGSLVIGFPQTTPPSLPDFVDITSPRSIMNHSQINLTGSPNLSNPTASLGSASTYTGWNGPPAGSTGIYYQVQGAPTTSENTSLTAKSYRSRGSDDPSVSLSIFAYDWLRHAYLRPNVAKVVTELSKPFSQTPKSAYLQTNETHKFAQDFIPGAYAEEEPLHPVSFGIFNIPSNGKGDPRNLSSLANQTALYRRQLANVFGYVPAQITLPETSLVVSIQRDGQVTTTNGEPAETLVMFWDALMDTNNHAGATFNAAMSAAKKLAQQAKEAEDKITQYKTQLAHDTAGDASAGIAQQENLLKSLETKLERAINTIRNADYALRLAAGMLNDRKTLTALGVKKMPNNNYAVAGNIFYTPTKSATIEQVLGEGAISTGQQGNNSPNDWSTPVNKEGASALIFIGPDAQKASRGLPDGSSFLPPVLAATSITQDQTEYVYVVQGDASAGGGGNVAVLATTDTGYGANVLTNQYVYQNTASLITTAKDSPSLIWNCMARNNGALDSNAGYYNDSSHAAGWNGTQSVGGNDYPLIAEWTLRCPAPSPEFTPVPLCKTRPAFYVVGDGNTWAAVQAKIDSLGNITYWYAGKQLHSVPADEGDGKMNEAWVQMYGDARKYNNQAKQNLRDQIQRKMWRDRAVISHISQLGASDRAKVDTALKKGGGSATLQVSNLQWVTQGLFSGYTHDGIGGFATMAVWQALNKQGALYVLETEKDSQKTCASFPAWGS
jgi:hypothetical protein